MNAIRVAIARFTHRQHTRRLDNIREQLEALRFAELHVHLAEQAAARRLQRLTQPHRQSKEPSNVV